MHALTYTEFSERLHEHVNRARVPVDGTIEVTHRCPLVCSHCYNNLPMSDLGARTAEMSLDEHRILLDELADLGCLWLLFTGGEIFARRDFLDIYDYAKRKGFLITLFTNGILIDERIADHLVDLPPFSIEITLYGQTKETYEKLTRIPGSYDKCMRAVDLLLERGLPLKLKTVGVAVNKHEVFDMKAFAQERGLEFKFDAMITPRIDCSSSPLGTRLSPVDIVELDLRDPLRVQEWKDLTQRCGAPVVTPGATQSLYQCGGGINGFAIDPYGNLSICIISQTEKINVRGGGFAAAWNGVLKQVRSKPITRETKCTHCALGSLCGMCPATGELENGDPEAPVDFLCHVAHLRAEAFGMDVPAHGECEYCGERRSMIIAEAGAAHDAVRGLPPVPSLASLPEAACGTGTCASCQPR